MATAAHAGPGDVYPGDTFHAAPFDFLFGNHIDTHQQLKLKEKTGGKPATLKGSFYIIFTDDQGVSLGIDPDSGLPKARHPRGLVLEDDGVTIKHDEACGVSPNIVCVVGWRMRGLPGAAKFVSHAGVNGNDHPIWMVNRAEEASAPAPGMVIPQPGSYTHMHWITRGSVCPRSVRQEKCQPAGGQGANGSQRGVRGLVSRDQSRQELCVRAWWGDHPRPKGR
jgi:hypothetical protein